MKECRCCKIKKCRSQFWKRITNTDGLYSYCKECTSTKNRQTREKNKEFYKRKVNEYKEKNREKINESAKQYYYKNRKKKLEKRAEYRKKNKSKISLKEALKRMSDKDRFEKNRQRHYEWSKENRKKLNDYQKQWYQKNKEKRRAHVILNRAIKSGKIMRPNSCSQCNVECKPDGHHEDYNKPLEVIWICRKCHSRKSPRTVLK